MAQQRLSPAQRANLFAQSTRQYKQELPAMTWKEGEQISINIPKTRFLSKVYVRVKGTFTAKHATKTTMDLKPFAPQKLLRQIRLGINNGFTPYQIGGAELALYNMTSRYSEISKPSGNAYDIFGNVVSASGANNKIIYTLELPMTINDRDPIGLIMLQNEQTVVTLSIDCGYFADILKDTDIEFTDYSIQVTPIVETFSIPQIPEAVPDYSIIKIVNQQIENVVGAGEMIIKLPVGLTYRKLLIYIASDTDMTPIDHDLIGNFQLKFNQADTPYNVSADYVAYQNAIDYAGQLPKGFYAFDFSSQGVANLGGGRDYIDTERLTEFWLTINFKQISGNSNYVYIVKENLARLV